MASPPRVDDSLVAVCNEEKILTNSDETLGYPFLSCVAMRVAEKMLTNSCQSPVGFLRLLH